jgi:hypothetical protein
MAREGFIPPFFDFQKKLIKEVLSQSAKMIN